MALVGSGVLGPKEAEDFELLLRAGTTYSIYVDPDEPDVDFDLLIYDADNNLIARDTTTDSDALCLVTPQRTGRFRLVIRSERGLSSYHVSVHQE